MDTLDYLKSEHGKLQSLYFEFEKADQDSTRRKLLASFLSQLQAINKVVLAVVYPLLDKFEEAKPILMSLHAEHAQIIHDMRKVIEAVKVDREQIESTMERLVRAVRLHFDHEEMELFPVIKNLMKRPEREKLARHMQGYLLELKKTRAA